MEPNIDEEYLGLKVATFAPAQGYTVKATALNGDTKAGEVSGCRVKN